MATDNSLKEPLLSDQDDGYQTFGLSMDEKPTLRDRFLSFVRSNRFLMYVCCFITSWGDRMWNFAIGVYMIALYPESLELTAIYGFLYSGGSLVFGAIIGDMIDKAERLKAVRVALIIRNLSIFTCSAAVFVVFTFLDKIEGTWLSPFSKAAIIFLAVLAHLASMANNITVTKDWVVVVCGNNKESLMEMSAVFRRIDLACKIVSPIVVGQIMSFATNAISAVFICCENIVTLIVMYAILRAIYRRVPRLAIKEDVNPLSNSNDDGEDNQDDIKIIKSKKENKWANRLCSSCISLYKGWRCYYRHPVCLAGMSLAMTFMTVLGFDNVTVGYAYSQGLTPSTLSWIMSVSAVTGIIGTILFLPMRSRLGLMVTGVIAYIVDLLFLQLCVWAVFTPGSVFLKFPATNSSMENVTDVIEYDVFNLSDNASTVAPSVEPRSSVPINVSIILLMSGIVLSRIGLWLADLTVTQLLLETVVEKERGKVNGVQYAISMFMDLVKFGLVILIPEPEYFGYLILLSFFFMAMGLVIFFIYAFRNKFIDKNRKSQEADDENKEIAGTDAANDETSGIERDSQT